MFKKLPIKAFVFIISTRYSTRAIRTKLEESNHNPHKKKKKNFKGNT